VLIACWKLLAGCKCVPLQQSIISSKFVSSQNNMNIVPPNPAAPGISPLPLPLPGRAAAAAAPPIIPVPLALHAHLPSSTAHQPPMHMWELMAQSWASLQQNLLPAKTHPWRSKPYLTMQGKASSRPTYYMAQTDEQPPYTPSHATPCCQELLHHMMAYALVLWRGGGQHGATSQIPRHNGL